MKKISMFIIIVSIIFIPVFSQIYKGKGKMRGIVSDENGNPIAGVKVKLFNLKAQGGYDTKTNKKGIWKAFFIRGGQWYVDLIKEGYEMKKITTPVVKESNGKMIEIETTLKKVEGQAMSKNLLKEYEKGNNLYNSKKYKEALTVFNNIVKESPDTYIINLGIGNCYMQLTDYDKAIDSYKKVIAKEPKHIDAIIAIGNCYSNKKDSKTALIWYAKIDATKIKDAVVLYNIGVFNFNASKSKEAVKFFKLALKTDDKYLDAYYQLGLSYIGLAKMKEAIAVFKKYLIIDKDSARSKGVKQMIKDIGGTL